jgi:N-acetylglucosaminyl-diphospho-decaprenol L-rhamnosyltransferase
VPRVPVPFGPIVAHGAAISDGSPRLLSLAVTGTSIVVASYNVWPQLERCLAAVTRGPHDVIVVDSASTDGTQQYLRDKFPQVRLIEFARNDGYGAALNAGIAVATGRYLLVMNADAWPVGDGIARLVEFAESRPDIGIAGPRLLDPDGTLQRSVRGFPTGWRLATEYFFLRWFAPRSRLLNAFYGAGFDHRTPRDAEFLTGAVLLLRRTAVEEVGAFDTDFFMFSEEVDLCYRMREAGWRVAFTPSAQFVHVGGASTRLDWPPMYREQIRGHLRFFAKHHGSESAERIRRMLVCAFRVRSLVFRGQRRRLTRETADWLASGDVATLLDRRRA